MHSLYKYMQQYVPVTPSEWQLIEENLHFKPILATEYVVNESVAAKHNFYFLETGTVQVNDANTAKVLAAPAVLPTLSALQAPSLTAIQATTNCAVWQLTQPDYDNIQSLQVWQQFIGKLYPSTV